MKTYMKELPDEQPLISSEIPRFPCGSLQYEADIFMERCLKCGSSMSRKWVFFKTGGCIQPACKNYSPNDQALPQCLTKKTHQ